MTDADYDIHEILVCINKNTTIIAETRKSKFTKEKYIKSAD
ncbi:hypothetical protein [Francisella tularensis]|nr:hypothetical protein [Francisella tularensis]